MDEKIDQWDGTQNPDIDPVVYRNFNFDKVGLRNGWVKQVFTHKLY